MHTPGVCRPAAVVNIPVRIDAQMAFHATFAPGQVAGFHRSAFPGSHQVAHRRENQPAAIALRLMGRAKTPAEADAEARRLWASRPAELLKPASRAA